MHNVTVFLNELYVEDISTDCMLSYSGLDGGQVGENVGPVVYITQPHPLPYRVLAHIMIDIYILVGVAGKCRPVDRDIRLPLVRISVDEGVERERKCVSDNLMECVHNSGGADEIK